MPQVASYRIASSGDEQDSEKGRGVMSEAIAIPAVLMLWSGGGVLFWYIGMRRYYAILTPQWDSSVWVKQAVPFAIFGVLYGLSFLCAAAAMNEDM